MEMYNCPACLAVIRTEKEFGVETCPECQKVWGLGDLKLNQPEIDSELQRQAEAEIWAENAWLREAEGWNRFDPEDEHERALEATDPGLIALREEHEAWCREHPEACDD